MANEKSSFSAKSSGGSDSSRNPNRSRNSNGSHSAKGSGASNSSRNSKGSGVTNSSNNSKNSGNSNGSHNANGSGSSNSSRNSKKPGNGTDSRSAKGSDSSNSPQSANGLQNIGDAHDTNKAPKSGNSAVLSAQRERGRKEYSDPIKVEQKWLREYGHMTKDEDSYEVNKSCITEVFNMLDYVAENKIYEFCADAEDISEEDAGLTRKIRKNGQEYTFEKPNQKFYSQIKTLQIFGFNI